MKAGGDLSLRTVGRWRLVREERECSQGERGNQSCSNKERASGREFCRSPVEEESVGSAAEQRRRRRKMTREKNNSIHQEILTPEHSTNLVQEQQQQLERWLIVKEEEELSNCASG